MNQSHASVTVVAGGGVAGLLAAAALRHLGPVTIVEPDPDDAWESGQRAGVPHGRQLHNLLGRAQLHLEQLVPGLLDELVAGGAVRGGVADDTLVVEYGHEFPRRDLGLALLSVTRQQLEEALAHRVLSHGVTRVRGAVVAIGHDQHGVCAAVVRREPEAPGDDGTVELEARLVVDATGRRAAAVRWTAEAGLPGPEATTLTTRQWYASVVVPAAPATPPFALVFPTANCPYGGLLSPAGDGLTRVSLNGSVGTPPRDLDQVAALAQRLVHPAVADALAGAIAAPERPAVHAFGAPQAVWRRYDRMADPVPGLVPLGDAVAHLSPLFGQGVSGTTWEAAGLAAAFQGAADHGPGRETATRRYLAGSGRTRRAMWDLMTVQDPGGPGDLDEARAAALVARVAADPVAHAWYVRMWHLLAPVEVLATLARGGAVDEAAWSSYPGAA